MIIAAATFAAAHTLAVGDMFEQAFMRHAFVAGTGIAAAAGLVGYFLVLRAQVFTGDALSHVAFTGALAALVLGLDLRIGLFVGTVAVGIAMGVLGRQGRPDDVAIGSTFAWILGIGVLLLTVYTRSRGTADGAAGVHVLFGSIFGLTSSQAWAAAGAAVIICGAVLIMSRPLLFATVDEAVAAARGVPVRLLGIAFLALVGATSAVATQAVGALLLLGLLAAPAGAAVRLTARPAAAMAMSAGLAVVAVWIGLTLSYLLPRVPPSFAIVATATAIYATAVVVTALRGPGDHHAVPRSQ